MDENITIENWWTDLQKKYRNYMGSGYDFIDHVDKTITRSGGTEKKETIDFLTQTAIRQDSGMKLRLQF